VPESKKLKYLGIPAFIAVTAGGNFFEFIILKGLIPKGGEK